MKDLHLHRYSDYRSSGLAWVGAIPSHWETQRAKWLFDKRDRPVRPQDDTITAFRDGVVTLRKNRRTTGFTESLKEIGYQGIRKGDLVIHAMDAFAGAVGVSDSDGKGSPVYAVCEPSAEANAKYYAHIVREMARTQYIRALSTGIRQRSTDFRYSTFSNEELPVPPREEQDAIARFCIAFEQRISLLVRAKQRLIALLNEQKRAIIQRAVTRGLDPKTQHEPSGVEALGEIPAEWDVRSLWTLAIPRKESNPGGLDLLSVFLDRGVIPYGEGGGQVHAPSLDLSNYQVARPGDFVLNNQQAWRGSVGVSQLHGIVSPAYLVLEMSSECNAVYTNYLMRSRPLVDQFLIASRGVGDIQRQIYWPHLRQVQVPLPPIQEQERIADFLDEEVGGIDDAIALERRSTDLLNEYRTRLTSDVVTGKLDVRDAELLEIEDGFPADLEIGVEEPQSLGEEAFAHAED